MGPDRTTTGPASSVHQEGSTMFNALEPWHLLIIVGVLVVLFGAKRLPGSARSLGRSMRIFRSEMARGKAGEDGVTDTATTQPAAVTGPVAPTSASIDTQPAPPVAAL
jgi:sec-independent protein translocase protein TatA